MAQLTDYFAQALLVQLNKQIIHSGRYFPFEEFAERVSGATKPPIPTRLLKDVLITLIQMEFLSVVDDDIAGEFVKLEYNRVNKYVESSIAAGNNFIYRYARVGDALLETIVDRLREEGDAEGETLLPTTTDPLEDVPAADRIVSRTDNQPEIEAIRSNLSEIQGTINENNEVGAELGDQREIISLEIEIADDVLQRPRFRLKSLLNWLLPALSFLSDKFATAAIGDLARRLVEMLLALH